MHLKYVSSSYSSQNKSEKKTLKKKKIQTPTKLFSVILGLCSSSLQDLMSNHMVAKQGTELYDQEKGWVGRQGCSFIAREL